MLILIILTIFVALTWVIPAGEFENGEVGLFSGYMDLLIEDIPDIIYLIKFSNEWAS